jgi:alpha-galactosidase
VGKGAAGPTGPALLTRRDVLGLAVAAPLAFAQRGAARALDATALAASPSRVVPFGPSDDVNAVQVVRDWNGPLCRSTLVNRGRRAARIKEVVLFEAEMALPTSTRLYGEGFQMLTQTGGTLGAPVSYSNYTDAGHYKLPEPEGSRVYYGLLTLSPPADEVRVLAFTSCRRFSGSIRVRGASLQVVMDTEGLAIAPGDTWELEEFTFRSGRSREALLADVASRLAGHHPPALSPVEGSALSRVEGGAPTPPTGWCSWYCFGPRVTAQQVLDNLDAIEQKIPGLTYVQIDDGYQPTMGDWLETGSAFEGNVQRVLNAIRRRGFQPAIWVAPFIAEEASHVFQEHRDWFVKDAGGAPLRSDRVTFGGWRRGPWYALDGTHPEVQQHFEQLFRTMRTDWGCTYFKLDANFWGAMHGGRFHDPGATRVEAYRRGMQAVRRGAGDSFILGCNHPMWPSIGVVNGSRSSNDIKRAWDRVSTTARQNLSRNWQNGRLWWNDPDAIVLTGDLTEDEFRFHATAIYASGGMLLSGDDLTTIPPARLAMLRKLVPPIGIAARFDDDALEVGVVTRPQSRSICVFNWSERAKTFTVALGAASRVRDFWSDEPLGRHGRSITVKDVPAHGARLLVCEP